MRKKGIRKNEALLWFGSWTSRIGNIVFDYFHALDENGTEIYQGIERGRDQDDA